MLGAGLSRLFTGGNRCARTDHDKSADGSSRCHERSRATLIYAHVDTEAKSKVIEAVLGGNVITNLDAAPYTIDDEELLRRLYGQ